MWFQEPLTILATEPPPCPGARRGGRTERRDSTRPGPLGTGGRLRKGRHADRSDRGAELIETMGKSKVGCVADLLILLWRKLAYGAARSTPGEDGRSRPASKFRPPPSCSSVSPPLPVPAPTDVTRLHTRLLSINILNEMLKAQWLWM